MVVCTAVDQHYCCTRLAVKLIVIVVCTAGKQRCCCTRLAVKAHSHRSFYRSRTVQYCSCTRLALKVKTVLCTAVDQHYCCTPVAVKLIVIVVSTTVEPIHCCTHLAANFIVVFFTAVYVSSWQRSSDLGSFFLRSRGAVFHFIANFAAPAVAHGDFILLRMCPSPSWFAEMNRCWGCYRSWVEATASRTLPTSPS